MPVSSECCMGRRDGEFTTHQPSPPNCPWGYMCKSKKIPKKNQFKKNPLHEFLKPFS